MEKSKTMKRREMEDDLYILWFNARNKRKEIQEKVVEMYLNGRKLPKVLASLAESIIKAEKKAAKLEKKLKQEVYENSGYRRDKS